MLTSRQDTEVGHSDRTEKPGHTGLSVWTVYNVLLSSSYFLDVRVGALLYSPSHFHREELA